MSVMAANNPRKPDLFIVGAAKCGTSALFDFLEQHPDIFMSEEKEPHFLESDMRLPSDKRTLEWYLSLFRNAKDEKRIGEASPSYLYSRTAAREIKDLSPAARIIIMIRNPVEMLYSVYYQRLSAGCENMKNFGDSVFRPDDRAIRFRAKAEKRIGLRLPVYLDVPRFTEQIERYLNVFDRERVHIIVHDDFKEDNAGSYRKVLQFLDVDESFRPEFRLINANKRFRSRMINALFQNAPRGLVESAKKLPFLVTARRKIDDINRVRFERPQMEPTLRRRLNAEFAPDVERLSRLLGRDLTYWTMDSGLSAKDMPAANPKEEMNI